MKMKKMLGVLVVVLLLGCVMVSAEDRWSYKVSTDRTTIKLYKDGKLQNT